MLLWILVILFAPLVYIVFPTRIVGRRYLKIIKKKAAIYTANHQTFNDPVIFKGYINPNVKIMAKRTLFKSKFSNWLLRKLGAFPVGRGENDITAVKTTLGLLKQNKKILIFPEGTRIKNNDSFNLKNGVVVFALKTDSYVVPTIFRKITKPFRFNTMLIDKPFKFSELEEFKDKKIDKDLHNQASIYLQSRMEYLRNVNIKEYKKSIKRNCKSSKF